MRRLTRGRNFLPRNKKHKGGWEGVAAPVGWVWTPPFGIQQRGRSFRVDPAFDLRAYAGVSVAKTYYVATDGLDTNSGLDAAHPLARVSTALNKADGDRVMVKAGTYPYGTGWSNASPNRSHEVIGYGGKVTLSVHLAEGALAWSAVNNHYEAVYATGFGVVVDFKTLDVSGDGIPLAHQTSAANVDANAGSWYYDTTAHTLSVRALDSRLPDGDIRSYIGDSNGRMDDPVTYYVQGIDFEGGEAPFLAGVANTGAKIYFENCSFKYSDNYAAKDALTISGCGEAICVNCVAARNSGDGFKAVASGAVVANLALIGCIGRNNGLASSTNSNGYSRHGPGSTVAIGCEFFGNYGPNVADITDGTLTWLLGCNCHDPKAALTGCNYVMDNNTTMWLDCCTSSGPLLADLRAVNAASTIKYRNLVPASPTTIGPGTVVSY